MNRVRVAGQELLSARLLTPTDLAVIVNGAAQSLAFK
jgi:hypothetical protein